jgi:hypothetical protein
MAEAKDSTITKGDTWPPQRFALKDKNDALVNFKGAEEATALIRGKKDTVLISGEAVAIDPPEQEKDGEGNVIAEWNGKYVWQEGDTDQVADDYDVEVRIKWGPGDKEGDPDKVQTFPTKNPRPTLEIVESNA